MTIALTGTEGFFTRFGLFGGGLNEINLFRGTTVGITRVANLRAQFVSTDQQVLDQLYATLGDGLAGSSYTGVHQLALTYYATLSAQTLVAMAQRSSPLVTGTAFEALNVLIAQMKGSNDSVQSNTVSVSTSALTNVGDGVLAASVLASDGKNLEQVFAETLQVKITADSYTGGSVAGQESYSVKGVVGTSDQLHYLFGVSGYGSNAAVQGRAISAIQGPSQSGNLLANSDYENWGALNPNLPNNWIVGVGLPGTDILKATVPYSGANCLEFLGDGLTLSSIRQQFNSPSSGTTTRLSPRQVIAVSFRTRIGPSAPAAGVLRISLVNAVGTVINNDAGNPCQFDTNLVLQTTSYAAITGFLQLPSILPSAVFFQVGLATALSAAKFVYVDFVAAAIAAQMYNPTSQTIIAGSNANNIAGGPYVMLFSGATNFALNDQLNAVVSNSYNGKFSMLAWKLLSTPKLGVRIPTSGTPTISDALVV
jgi:hypothetical protein